MRLSTSCVVVAALAASFACGGGNTGPQDGNTAPGRERAPGTRALESAANMVQSKAPIERISMYLNGFHAAKDDPRMQMESHHYCDQVNEDFAQCVLYDGNTPEARLHGVEYIISERLYSSLPSEEKAYWHPHNYEILSGQLRMPGIPDAAEKDALRRKINSYGKTWHFWMSGVHEQKATPLPTGPPHLAWSFNRDGEAAAGLVEDRDRRLGVNTTEARKQRADLAALAKPQGGVDALVGAFGAGTRPLPSVTDNGDAAARPVPTIGIHGADAKRPGSQ